MRQVTVVFYTEDHVSGMFIEMALEEQGVYVEVVEVEEEEV